LKDTDKGPRRSLKDTRRSLVGAVAIGNKMVRDGQLESTDFVTVDKRQSRLPSPFIQLRNPCA
ncbi:hypothetical protein Tco_0293493, partial [Tanacetum coccineum]